MADQDTNVPISAPLDGQIALTAHNNGDGTWSVKRGPDGPILKDGLAREEALAIVGAPTGPYEPANPQQAAAAEQRAGIEAAEAQREASEVFKPDCEVEGLSKNEQALSDENGDLRRSLASRDEDIRQLKAQLAKFDPDGDGKAGGRVSKDAGTGGAKAKNGEA